MKKTFIFLSMFLVPYVSASAYHDEVHETRPIAQLETSASTLIAESASPATKQTFEKNLNILQKIHEPDAMAHHLGHGVNVLKGQILARQCLNNVNYYRTPHVSKSIKAQVIQSSEETTDFYKTTLDMNLEGGFNEFHASAALAYEMTQEISSLRETSAVAIAMRQTLYDLNIDGWPTLDAHAAQWLLAGTEASKINFRRYCGDALVNHMTLGKELNAMIFIESSSHTREEREKFALDMKASLMGEGSGSLSSTLESLHKKFNKEYHFSISFYATGDNGLYSNINLENFREKMEQFETLKAGDGGLLSFHTERYENPTLLPDKETFLDERPSALKLNQWAQFMSREVAPRCEDPTGLGIDPLLCMDLRQTYAGIKDALLPCQHLARLCRSNRYKL